MILQVDHPRLTIEWTPQSSHLCLFRYKPRSRPWPLFLTGWFANHRFFIVMVWYIYLHLVDFLNGEFVGKYIQFPRFSIQGGTPVISYKWDYRKPL